MNLRQYMIIFGFGTLVAFAAWIMVVINIDPISTGLPGLVIFLLTLFAALLGLFTTLGTLMRGIRFKERDVEDILTTSMRQSFMLVILVISSLLLFRAELFTWLTMVILITVLAIVEFIVLSQKKKGTRTG